MINAKPAALHSPFLAPQAVPVAGGPISGSSVPTASPPSATGSNDLVAQAVSVLSNIFTGIIDFFKKLFAPAPPADPLSPSDAALATKYGLLANQDNINAFKAEVAAYATNNTLGPGNTDQDSIRQLQAGLARLGYGVSATGSYDQATIAAVVKFKQDLGLHQTYRSNDGNFAINEYATPDVAKALIDRIKHVVGA